MQEYLKPIIIAGVIAVIFASISFGIFYSGKQLADLRDEYNRLENRRVSLQSDIKTLYEQNKVLSDIETEKFIHAQTLNSHNGLVDFYSRVQKIFADRNIDVITTKQQDNSLVMSIQGNYYAFMHTLSDLRAMPIPSKINTINIRRNPTNPHLITSDLTIEALVSR